MASTAYGGIWPLRTPYPEPVAALAVYTALTGSFMGGHAGPKSWSMGQVAGRHRLILVQ